MGEKSSTLLHCTTGNAYTRCQDQHAAQRISGGAIMHSSQHILTLHGAEVQPVAAAEMCTSI
jgi:hypothetical protein